MKNKLVLIAIVLTCIGQTALADNKVKCSAKCTDPASKVSKELQCEFAVPAGISFSSADCVSQCTQKCIGSFGGRYNSGSPASKFQSKK